jgi:methionyl aminopeptidase
MVAEVLALLIERVKPGVTTFELDAFAAAEVVKRKAKAAFKGYCNYPSSLCCSPNNQVVHGIPSKLPLESGDILSLDFGILYDDFFGDAAITVPVGNVSLEAEKLINVTKDSLSAGICKAVPGGRLFDISHAIQSHVERSGYSVVRDFVGHGIGRKLHEDPQVPNYGQPDTGVRLKAGMVLAIEPMINEKLFGVTVLDDGWTVITSDGGLSAHFEHTIAITENGPEILTRIS